MNKKKLNIYTKTKDVFIENQKTCQSESNKNTQIIDSSLNVRMEM